MLDMKQFGMLGALLFLIVGIVGIVSLFGGEGNVTGGTVVEISSTNNCYDLDGQDEFISSFVEVEFENGVETIYEDTCESSMVLVEYVCGEKGVESLQITCDNACSNGACV
tara:strand:- start:292 stop:624 length:333 start_codon:yes stop_codon:yes gene_type:complete